MGTPAQLVVFSLDDQRFALPLGVVRRVVRASEVTALPNAPDAVCGLIDVQGDVIPVLDARARLGLPRRPVGVADHFIIAQVGKRTLALLIDQTHGLVQAQVSPAASGPAAACFEPFQGVAQWGDGLALIQDLEKFLSPAQTRALDRAMAGAHG